MNPKEKKEVVSGIFWEIYKNYVGDFCDENTVCVQFTEEVAKHLLEMYNATDWEVVPDLNLPEDWCGELTFEDIEEHIGEWISVNGFDSEDDLMSSGHFHDCTGFRYLDECLSNAAAWADELFGGNFELGLQTIWSIGEYITLAKKSGMSPSQIVSSFAKEIKNL